MWRTVMMLVAIVAGSVATVTGAAEKPAGGWEAYRSEKGKYSVRLPAKPTEEDSSVVLTQHPEKKLPDGQVTFRVDVLELTADSPVKGPTPAKTLDNLRDALATRVWEGAVQKEREVKLGDHPGREFIVLRKQIGSGGITITGYDLQYVARAYVVKDRVYVVWRMCSQSKDTAPGDAQKFLDSFELTK
ncbi:MAG TPA: hypothetical protein VEA69_18640 [Tepidisphaeraceae bacterium]|nr:hypothetical protein [Tepidisphaeraceae bacterium]